jgi:hypothetical protein
MKRDSWPTLEQEYLLKAALLQGQASQEAWTKWQQMVDIQTLDYASYRLLPLLYWNLNRQGIQTELSEWLKRQHRQTWADNQRLFHSGRSVLLSLEEAGIGTMLLKGSALVLNHYKDYGLRAMTDFDILVRREDAEAAMDVLNKLGWHSPSGIPESFIPVRHAIDFVKEEHQIDLHWHVLAGCILEGCDDEFWEGAIWTELSGYPAKIMNPSDQLLHVCVHGIGWNIMPPIRWIADAMTILNTSGGEIDWDRLANQAQKRRLLFALQKTLTYLRNLLDAPLPLKTWRKIQEMSTTKFERADYWFTTHRARKWEKKAQIRKYLHHARVTNDQRSLLTGYIYFLKNRWEVDQLWRMPFEGIRRGTRNSALDLLPRDTTDHEGLTDQ